MGRWNRQRQRWKFPKTHKKKNSSRAKYLGRKPRKIYYEENKFRKYMET